MQTTDSRPVVALSGDLDIYTAPDMREELARITEPAIVDLTKVQFIDAAALTELALLARRVGRGNLTLIVPRGFLTRLMTLVEFEHLCTIVSDRRHRSVETHPDRRRAG
ncbi:MAG: hypothetical protein JWM87_3210 [Candidatus Eremiobacteraeota bacterium]|nr:hypothetical protein [Candidatus Eremiobacteraeota bacterium]